ncbi:hypothetical protein BMS3Abin15_01226 [bacterium BMS3Abin15]|nr:hypothetical protein BMS3Abin15_01226 [bacterium BMS3Abin15]
MNKMEELKEQYQEIENDFSWPKRNNAVGESNQFYQIAKSLRVKVQECSINERLNPEEYEQRLHILTDFLDDIRLSFIEIDFDSDLNDKNENKQHLWYHRSSQQVQGLNDQDTKETNKDVLLETAAKYLKYEWLQLNSIDWIFLDSLIFSELAGYRESIVSGEVFGKINWNYILAGGNMEKNYWITLKKALAFFVIRYIIPPAVIAVLFYFDHKDASLVVGGLYIAYLIIRIIMWPFRYRKRNKEEKDYLDHFDRLQKMVNVYYYCKLPVISPSTLKSSLQKALDSGVVFDGVVHAILNRVLERDRNVFIPFESDI